MVYKPPSRTKGEITTILTLLSLIVVSVGIFAGSSVMQTVTKLVGHAKTKGSTEFYEVNLEPPRAAAGRNAADKFIISGTLCYKETPPNGTRYNVQVFREDNATGLPDGQTGNRFISTPSRVKCGNTRSLVFKISLNRLPETCPKINIKVNSSGRNPPPYETVVENFSVPSEFCGEQIQVPSPTQRTDNPVKKKSSTVTPSLAPPINKSVATPTIKVSCRNKGRSCEDDPSSCCSWLRCGEEVNGERTCQDNKQTQFGRLDGRILLEPQSYRNNILNSFKVYLVKETNGRFENVAEKEIKKSLSKSAFNFSFAEDNLLINSFYGIYLTAHDNRGNEIGADISISPSSSCTDRGGRNERVGLKTRRVCFIDLTKLANYERVVFTVRINELTLTPIPTIAIVTPPLRTVTLTVTLPIIFPTNTPSPTTTIVPSPTPTPRTTTPGACGQSCGTGRTCQPPLICIDLAFPGATKCVNPNNPTNPHCLDPTPTPTSVATPTPVDFCNRNDTSLLGKLRCGGLVIVFRHTDTIASQNIRERAMIGDLLSLLRNNNNNVHTPAITDLLRDCNRQRLLSGKGRTEASQIGNAINSQHIPVGRVFTSPWCRTQETAQIAFGKHAVDADNLFEQIGDPESSFNKDYVKKLKSLLRQSPQQAANTVIVTHSGPIMRSVGVNEFGQGSAIIYENGSPISAILGPDDWASLMPNTGQQIPSGTNSVQAIFSINNNASVQTVRSVNIRVCDVHNRCRVIEKEVKLAPGQKQDFEAQLAEIGILDGTSVTCTLVYTDLTTADCGSRKVLSQGDRAVKFELDLTPSGSLKSAAISTLDAIDVNNDCEVNTLDYAYTLQTYGQCGENVAIDNTFDNCTNAADISNIIGKFGKEVCKKN